MRGHFLLLLVFAVLQTVTLNRVLAQNVSPTFPFFGTDDPRHHELPAHRDAFPDEIPNAGFEELDTAGHPVGWNVLGLPVVLNEAGNNFARINSTHHYQTDIAPPFARRHLTLSLRARGELGIEVGSLRLASLDFSDAPEPIFPEKRYSVSDDWRRVFGTFAMFPEYEFLRVIPWSADATNWIDIDDLILFDEGLRNGDFETVETGSVTDWLLTGNASIIDDSAIDGTGLKALTLAPGASATKLAGAVNDGQHYFIAGSAKAIGSPGVLEIRESWLSASGIEIGDSFTTTAIGLAPQQFLWESGNFDGGEASDVSFMNVSGSFLMLDDLSRGFTQVFPEVYDPDPACPTMQLTAAWPDNLTSATVEIWKDDALVRTIVLENILNGAAWQDVDFSELAPGNYEARFALANGKGRIINITREFEVRDSPPLPEPLAAPFDDIRRIAWIWTFDLPNDPEAMRPYFESALEDGFTEAILFDFASDFPAAAQAAEEVGLPLIFAPPDSAAMIRSTPSFADFNRADYEAKVQEELAPVLGSPIYRGFYVVDEPELDRHVRHAATAMRIAALHPEWKTPHMVVAPTSKYLSSLTIMSPPSVGVDYYTFRTADATNCPGNYEEIVSVISDSVALSRSMGRDMWYVFQGLTDPYGFRLANESNIPTFGGIALALGARGYSPFVYKGLNHFDGIRGRFGEPTTALEPMRQLNAKVSAANDLLMELHSHQRVTSIGPVLMTAAQHSNGNNYIFLVPLECFNPIQIQLAMSAESGTITNALTNEAVAFTGFTGEITLQPGNWQIFDLGAHTSNFAGASILPTSESTITLPVLLDQVVPNAAIHDISFVDDDKLILAGLSRAVLMTSEGEVLASHALSNVLRVEAGDEFSGVSDRTLGLFAMRNNPPYDLVPSLVRHTGSASNLLFDDDEAWIGMQYRGVRRLGIDSNGIAETAALAAAGSYTETFSGPFSDGSVLYLDTDRAVQRAEQVAPGVIVQEPQYEGDRLWRSALSPAGKRLAVAQMKQGISIHRVGPDGTIIASHSPFIIMHFVEDVAWVGENILAAIDVNGLMKLFAVQQDLTITELATWRYATRDAALMTIETHGPVIALGYYNGRVVLLDGSEYYEAVTAGPQLWSIR